MNKPKATKKRNDNKEKTNERNMSKAVELLKEKRRKVIVKTASKSANAKGDSQSGGEFFSSEPHGDNHTLGDIQAFSASSKYTSSNNKKIVISRVAAKSEKTLASDNEQVIQDDANLDSEIIENVASNKGKNDIREGVNGI